jgi:hypothetical protein
MRELAGMRQPYFVWLVADIVQARPSIPNPPSQPSRSNSANFDSASVDLDANLTALQTQTYLAHSLTFYLGASSPADLEQYGFSSARDVTDLLTRVRHLLFSTLHRAYILSLQFTTNAYTLTTPTLTPIGVALSPVLALANHSCAANAVIVQGRSSRMVGDPSASSTKWRWEHAMRLVVIRDVEPDEEVGDIVTA